MTLGSITEQYAARGGELPGAAELDGLRRTALARFGELGLPTRRIETWHYTDLGSLADKALDYVGAEPDTATLSAAGEVLETLGLDAAAPQLVFVDGHLSGELSRLEMPAGLAIETLAAAPTRLLPAADSTETALTALNTAFVRSGALLRVTGAAATPVQLVFIGSGRGLAPQQRLRIELARDASATLVQHFVDLPDAGEAWLNLVTDIEQDAGSELTLYRLQRHGADRYQTALTRATLAAGASLTAGSVETGGRLVRNEFLIALAGEEARAEIRGLALTRDRQHCDTRVAVDHRAARTTSRQEYRAIAADRSRSAFNGKVTVREHAQHIDARQRNDNLLLSTGAEIDTKPELEIYADQVICSHGATVGELSEDELFYLRARGIDAETARAILTTAFAEVILGRLALESFREQARATVSAQLPRGIELE